MTHFLDYNMDFYSQSVRLIIIIIIINIIILQDLITSCVCLHMHLHAQSKSSILSVHVADLRTAFLVPSSPHSLIMAVISLITNNCFW